MTMNVFEYLAHLNMERYRAVIIHAEPEKGPAVTKFCQKLCQQMEGKYLDLLDFFIHNLTLSQNIDSFSPEKFRELLIEQSDGCNLLVVDRADFLLDTWRRSERQAFYRLFDNQWDGFKDGMRAKLILCLQTSQEILGLQVKDSKAQSKVFRLNDFNDIA